MLKNIRRIAVPEKRRQRKNYRDNAFSHSGISTTAAAIDNNNIDRTILQQNCLQSFAHAICRLDQDDWQQQTLFSEQYLPIPKLAALKHGHISVRQLLPHLPTDTWDSYFKFGFVRNPFDRFVSTCFFLNRQDANFEKSAITFMKRALSTERFRQRILVRPQTRILTNDQSKVVVDAIGRYEELQKSYDEICARIGIPTTELGRKNPSSHDAYTEYYDDELRNRVASYYADDLRIFSYDFDS